MNTIRLRRPLASVLTVGLLVGGLAIAPIATSAASAASNAQNAVGLIDKLDDYRTAADIPAFKTNRNLQQFAGEAAEYYAKHGTLDTLNFSTLSPQPPGAASTNAFYYRVTGSNSAATTKVAKMIRDDSRDAGPTSYLFNSSLNYGSAGIATRGGYTYAYVSILRYDETPQETVKPSITGTRAVGKTVKASYSGWKPTPADPKFQWYANGEAISGEKSAALVITSSLVGTRLSVKVVSSPANYGAGSRLSGQTGAVALGTIAAKTPVVSGSRVVGATLTVTPGNWGSGVSYAYQWYRNGETIAGTTDSTYKLRSADKGKRIDARVLGTKTGYSAIKKFTATTVKTLMPFTAGKPTISGSPSVGAKLSASIGSWTPSAADYAFQWKRDDANISGATGKSYTVTKADAGHSITVTVTGTRSGYKTASATSAGRSIG